MLDRRVLSCAMNGIRRQVALPSGVVEDGAARHTGSFKDAQ